MAALHAAARLQGLSFRALYVITALELLEMLRNQGGKEHKLEREMRANLELAERLHTLARRAGGQQAARGDRLRAQRGAAAAAAAHPGAGEGGPRRRGLAVVSAARVAPESAGDRQQHLHCADCRAHGRPDGEPEHRWSVLVRRRTASTS